MSYRILLIEDQALVRESLASLLNCTQRFTVSVSAESIEAALQCLHQPDHFDLILCDYHLRQSTAENLLRSHQRPAGIPVVVLTSHFNAIALQHCRSLGAQGFLFKESSIHDFIQALTLIAQGGEYFAAPEPDPVMWTVASSADDTQPSTLDLQLTDAELDTLKWLATGMSNKQIALSTGKSAETVKTHIARILKKLNCKTRTQAVTKASHFNLI